MLQRVSHGLFYSLVVKWKFTGAFEFPSASLSDNAADTRTPSLPPLLKETVHIACPRQVPNQT